VRFIRSVRRAAFAIKAQVFHYQDQVGTIVAEEYARAAFRYFVATIPIATGLLQHSASVTLVGGGKISAEVLRDSRGNSAPVTAWSGNHWRTRVAYSMPAHPHLVTVRLMVKKSAFDLKRTGLSATGGKFGLKFHCSRKAFDEPEFVQFLQRKNDERVSRGEPPKTYENIDISRVHAIDIIRRSSEMRGDLDKFMEEARYNINARIARLKK